MSRKTVRSKRDRARDFFTNLDPVTREFVEGISCEISMEPDDVLMMTVADFLEAWDCGSNGFSLRLTGQLTKPTEIDVLI